MSNKIINWEPREDKFTKRGEIDLHENLHEIKYHKKDFAPNISRLTYIDNLIAEKKIDLKGKKILEVGAGNGYLAVHIIKKYDPEIYYVLEPSLPAVDRLIRGNLESNDIKSLKYELVLGSYNQIPLKNHFDIVFAMGALHHSGNLQRTLDELYSTLKPGGMLIANEPYSLDTVPNRHFLEKEDKIKNVQGLINFREGDRDDHFFRHCEYLTASYHAGFEIDIVYTKQSRWKSLKSKFFSNVSKKGEDALKPRNFTLLLTKELDSESFVPHRW